MALLITLVLCSAFYSIDATESESLSDTLSDYYRDVVGKTYECLTCSTLEDPDKCSEINVNKWKKNSYDLTIDEQMEFQQSGCSCCVKETLDNVIYRDCARDVTMIACDKDETDTYQICYANFCNSAPPTRRQSSFSSAHVIIIGVAFTRLFADMM